MNFAKDSYYKKLKSACGMNSYLSGLSSENDAASFLKKSGYEILTTRYLSSHGDGEIDIVAAYHEQKYIVFVEVKYRKVKEVCLLHENITYAKKKKMTQAACDFLASSNDLYCNYCARFDIIFLQRNPFLTITHIENAFDQ